MSKAAGRSGSLNCNRYSLRSRSVQENALRVPPSVLGSGDIRVVGGYVEGGGLGLIVWCIRLRWFE